MTSPPERNSFEGLWATGPPKSNFFEGLQATGPPTLGEDGCTPWKLFVEPDQAHSGDHKGCDQKFLNGGQK